MHFVSDLFKQVLSGLRLCILAEKKKKKKKKEEEEKEKQEDHDGPTCISLT